MTSLVGSEDICDGEQGLESFSSTLKNIQSLGGLCDRSPHAMVNVLWSSQLEAAEVRRDSENLYVRNLKRLLSRGRELLESDALAEMRGVDPQDFELTSPRPRQKETRESSQGDPGRSKPQRRRRTPPKDPTKA